jgi:glycosyltransferase involved in cell wall biosynthesis
MSYPYLLSVRLMVYNHEAYIREAIEGILMQKTTFPIEVVVGDDFSTDHSLAIIREYKSTPQIHFKILERNEGDDYWQNRQKIGRLHNFYNILEHCSGKYIALLDGDDFWTDPLKLQKQVDFLENNPDFSTCFHNMKISNDSKSSEVEFTNIKNQESVSSILDLAIKGNFMFTASVVFRKPTASYPEWLSHLTIGDYPIHLYNAQFGKIKYLNHVMGVYRVHESGAWGVFSKEKQYEKWIPTLHEIGNKFTPEVNVQLVYQKKNALFDLYLIFSSQGEKDKAAQCMIQLMDYDTNYLARKFNNLEKKFDKTLNSNAYKIGTILIKFFTAPIQIFKNKK